MDLLLAKGVLFYHAQLPTGAKDLILKAFEQGVLKMLTCTTSLSTGINTPANLVVLSSL